MLLIIGLNFEMIFHLENGRPCKKNDRKWTVPDRFKSVRSKVPALSQSSDRTSKRSRTMKKLTAFIFP